MPSVEEEPNATIRSGASSTIRLAVRARISTPGSSAHPLPVVVMLINAMSRHAAGTRNVGEGMNINP